MICKPCRDAADYVTAYNPEGFAMQLSVVGVATMMHRGCDGETRCDCQHRVAAQAEGKSIQR